MSCMRHDHCFMFEIWAGDDGVGRKIYIGGVNAMAGISNEQQKRDERSLVGFLIIFNIAMLFTFLAICFYNSI
jgi:hypothetical protein